MEEWKVRRELAKNRFAQKVIHKICSKYVCMVDDNNLIWLIFLIKFFFQLIVIVNLTLNNFFVFLEPVQT